MESYYAFCDNLKRLRKEKGLTQKQLASLCGLTESSVRKYEIRQARPRRKTIEKIAQVLEVSVNTLLTPENLSLWEQFDQEINTSQLSKEVKTIELTEKMNDAFSRLNPAGQQKAVDYVNDLLQIDAYRLEE